MPAEIDLTQLFAPRSVAILGASPVPSPGRYIIETLQNFGFEGGIYLVSPNSEIVADTPYYDALFNAGTRRFSHATRYRCTGGSGFGEAGGAGQAI